MTLCLESYYGRCYIVKDVVYGTHLIVIPDHYLISSSGPVSGVRDGEGAGFPHGIGALGFWSGEVLLGGADLDDLDQAEHQLKVLVYGMVIERLSSLGRTPLGRKCFGARPPLAERHPSLSTSQKGYLEGGRSEDMADQVVDAPPHLHTPGRQSVVVVALNSIVLVIFYHVLRKCISKLVAGHGEVDGYGRPVDAQGALLLGVNIVVHLIVEL